MSCGNISNVGGPARRYEEMSSAMKKAAAAPVAEKAYARRCDAATSATCEDQRGGMRRRPETM